MRTLRLPLLRGFAADVAVAAVFVAVGQAEAWGGFRDGGIGAAYRGSRPLEALLVFLVTAPLAWRRRRPLLAAALVAAALAAHALFVAPEASFIAGLLPLALLVYSVAAWARPRLRLAGLAYLVGAQVVMTLRIPEMRTSGEILFGAFVTAGMWFVGDLSRSRQRRVELSEDRARRLEAEREEWLRAAVAEERARIARELHDVVAHSVSLMGVQAGAARLLLDDDREQARVSLHAIETTAREAVLELRRLLDILRDPGPAAALNPQPGLAQLGTLVEQIRAAGLPVELEGDAEPPLPAGVALAAYRIVQEALTNTLKHAGDARARVRIAHADGMLELEITDNGIGRRNGSHAAGHGLIGMRERAALYGGTLEAGPSSEGGYRVRARLPLEAGA